MKNITFLFALMLIIGTTANAQKAAEKTLKQVLTLKIDRPGGANGANVAWHPAQKKFYAAQAGNAEFPMEVFDAKGKMVSPDDLLTKFDTRGFWYNPNTKTFQANGYDDNGFAEFKLDSKGMPLFSKKLDLDISKPDAQSVGVYNPKKNVVYFYETKNVSIEPHNMKDGSAEDAIFLHLGVKNKADIDDKANDDRKTNYNENAIVFTGIAKAEVGLLNVTDKQIELYDIATGLMTQALKLPDDAPATSSLNFSFCNGIYWLFDKTERIWHGYK